MKAPLPAPSELQIRLVNRMAQHLGRNKGINADALALALQISPRRLRRLISQTRLQGVAICGKPATGYYMPETADELAEACNFLMRRALHSLKLMELMRTTAMPTLAGQQLLNQG
jgi:predicted DNA-binding transcriptional regulator YafY